LAQAVIAANELLHLPVGKEKPPPVLIQHWGGSFQTDSVPPGFARGKHRDGWRDLGI